MSSVFGSPFLIATKIKPSINSILGAEGPNLTALHSQHSFDSATYQSIAGGPLLLWLIPVPNAAALDTFASPVQSAGSAAQQLVDHCDSVSSSLLRHLSDASNAEISSAARQVLVAVTLTLSPKGILSGGHDALNELGGHHGSGRADYVYSSVVGGPTINWFLPFNNCADLDTLADPVAAVKSKGGGQLLSQLSDCISGVSSTLYRKIA